MGIASIRTKHDYHRALKEIEGLLDAKRGTPEGDRLDVLVTLVEAWEAKHYSVDGNVKDTCGGSPPPGL